MFVFGFIVTVISMIAFAVFFLKDKFVLAFIFFMVLCYGIVVLEKHQEPKRVGCEVRK